MKINVGQVFIDFVLYSLNGFFFQTTWSNYIEYEMNRTRPGCEVLPFSKRKLSVFKCKRSDVEKPYNVDNRIQIEIEVNPIEKVSNGCPTRFRC